MTKLAKLENITFSHLTVFIVLLLLGNSMVQNAYAQNNVYFVGLNSTEANTTLRNDRQAVKNAINEFRSENKTCYAIHRQLRSRPGFEDYSPYGAVEDVELYIGANGLAQNLATHLANGTSPMYDFSTELNRRLMNRDEIAATSTNWFHWKSPTYQEALDQWLNNQADICDTIMTTGTYGAGIGVGKVAAQDGENYQWTLIIFELAPLNKTVFKPGFKAN